MRTSYIPHVVNFNLLISSYVIDCTRIMLKSVMKRIVIVLFLFLPTLAYANPSIEFVNETYDFGPVTQGEQVEYTFEFCNMGTEELVIERIESS